MNGKMKMEKLHLSSKTAAHTLLGEIEPSAWMNKKGGVMSAADWKNHNDRPGWKWVIIEHWTPSIPLYPESVINSLHTAISKAHAEVRWRDPNLSYPDLGYPTERGCTPDCERGEYLRGRLTVATDKLKIIRATAMRVLVYKDHPYSQSVTDLLNTIENNRP